MPDRVIRDELLTSERYWSVSDESRLLYLHLLLCADDTARYTGQNFSLRTKCFAGRAMDAERMETLLSELVGQDLIRLYESGQERFVFIPRFRQRLRFTNSKFPAPPNEVSDLQIKKTDLGQTQDGLKTDSGQAQDRRSEEKRREVNIDTTASPKGDCQATEQPVEPKKTKSRGERLSPDWTLPEDWRNWCVQCRPDLDPDDVALVFKNHWIAKPGSGACKLNWYATWQNWVKSQRAMPARPMGTNAPSGALASKPYGFGGI